MGTASYWILNLVILIVINGLLSGVVSLLFSLDFFNIWKLSVIFSLCFKLLEEYLANKEVK